MSKTQTLTTPLEQLRLARDWSYAALAEQIRLVTGVRRTEATWSRICQSRVRPSARTKNAVDRFLAKHRTTAQMAPR